MCPSKTGTGTTAAFPVPAAPPPWWAKALYQTETKFCARAAAKQGPEPRLLTLLFPRPRVQDYGSFSEPLLGPSPSLEPASPDSPLMGTSGFSHPILTHPTGAP